MSRWPRAALLLIGHGGGGGLQSGRHPAIWAMMEGITAVTNTAANTTAITAADKAKSTTAHPATPTTDTAAAKIAANQICVSSHISSYAPKQSKALAHKNFSPRAA